MKKNILTIIIMAISLINTALIAVLIFSIVPAANRTTTFVNKIASIVDLELESPNPEDEITVADITNYPFTESIVSSLKSDDGKSHYLTVDITLQENMKNKDYAELSTKVQENESAISEIIETEFAKYTRQDLENETIKDKVKADLLAKIQEYFDSDFIINVILSKYLIE
jgi:flagellar basal body-associated protein FliL